MTHPSAASSIDRLHRIYNYSNTHTRSNQWLLPVVQAVLLAYLTYTSQTLGRAMLLLLNNLLLLSVRQSSNIDKKHWIGYLYYKADVLKLTFTQLFLFACQCTVYIVQVCSLEFVQTSAPANLQTKGLIAITCAGAKRSYWHRKIDILFGFYFTCQGICS